MPRLTDSRLLIDSSGSATASALDVESATDSRFPYASMSMWVNPFALVSSESEFNQDPSGTPEPMQADDITRLEDNIHLHFILSFISSWEYKFNATAHHNKNN